jgi:hypothetical protein
MDTHRLRQWSLPTNDRAECGLTRGFILEQMLTHQRRPKARTRPRRSTPESTRPLAGAHLSCEHDWKRNRKSAALLVCRSGLTTCDGHLRGCWKTPVKSDPTARPIWATGQRACLTCTPAPRRCAFSNATLNWSALTSRRWTRTWYVWGCSLDNHATSPATPLRQTAPFPGSFFLPSPLCKCSGRVSNPHVLWDKGF